MHATSLSARRAWIEIRPSYWPLGCGAGSLSARRAWIEIGYFERWVSHRGSLSARRAWIEIEVPEDQYTALSSLSARRAWIEISAWGRHGTGAEVALRKESVDRNGILALKQIP